jgi:putative polyhydroxyalkanoate system protein
MSTIHVDHQHSLSQEEALQRVRALVAELKDRVKADIQWNGSTATFKGTGFSGSAKVLDQRIALDLDLSLLLRPMKGKIEERIDRSLRQRLA